MKNVKANGSDDTEADRQAQNEAEGSIPDVDLLKARLLFDGGYYERAIKILESKKPEDYRDFKEQLELIYRKARIYDELGQDQLAIPLYQKTITMGAEYPYYFAANSALCLGLLYEEKGEKEKAKYNFNQCIQMDDHEYRTSLNGKAKAGLERLK